MRGNRGGGGVQEPAEVASGFGCGFSCWMTRPGSVVEGRRVGFSGAERVAVVVVVGSSGFDGVVDQHSYGRKP